MFRNSFVLAVLSLSCLLCFRLVAQSSGKGLAKQEKQEILFNQLINHPLGEDQVSIDRIKTVINTRFVKAENGFKAHYYIADYFKQIHAPEVAIREYHKALQYLDKLDNQQERVKVRVDLYVDMAQVFKLILVSDSALIFYNKALQVAELANNKELISSVSLRIGDWFYDQKIYTEALEYYNRAAMDSVQNQKIQIKKALVSMASGSANLDYLDNLYVSLVYADPENQQFIIAYANWLINQHYLLQASNLLPRIDTSLGVDESIRVEALKTYANYFLEVMDNNKARKILSEIDKVNANSEKRAFPKDVKWASRLNQTKVTTVKTTKSFADVLRANTLSVLLGLSASILLLALIVVLALNHRYKQALLAATVAAQHEPAPEISPAWVGHVDRSILEAMLAKLHEIQAIDEDSTSFSKVNNLTFELETLLNLGRERPQLLENVDHLFAAFYFNLADYFPTLDRTEQELMGLIRLNLNAIEIASLWNISEPSAQLHINALKEKIGLPEQDDLYVYIANL